MMCLLLKSNEKLCSQLASSATNKYTPDLYVQGVHIEKVNLLFFITEFKNKVLAVICVINTN